MFQLTPTKKGMIFEVWLQVVGDLNLAVFHCIKNLIISLDLYGLGIFSGECNSKEFGKLVSTEGGKKRKAEMPHDEVCGSMDS